jgi:hypothetical protein
MSEVPSITKVSSESVTLSWNDPDGVPHEQEFPVGHFRGRALRVQKALLNGGAYCAPNRGWPKFVDYVLSTVKKTLSLECSNCKHSNGERTWSLIGGRWHCQACGVQFLRVYDTITASNNWADGGSMGRRFKDQPSAIYKEAVRAIRELMEAEGGDSAGRACAEAMQDEVRRWYAEKKHRVWTEKSVVVTERQTSHVCIQRLKGAKRCVDTYDRPCNLTFEQFPAADHLSEWHVAGQTASVVSQPYNGLDIDDLRMILSFCNRNGLQVDISGASWHFLGHTLRIEYSRLKPQDAKAVSLNGQRLSTRELDTLSAAIRPSLSLPKKGQELWNRWHNDMWILADKALEASLHKFVTLETGEMRYLQELINVIPTVAG